MAAYIGSQKIDKCYLGTQEIDKVMLGAHEVCSATVADKPLTGDAADFLDAPTAHYYNGAKPSGWNNKSMESLLPDKVFPYGQQMFIGAYDAGMGAANVKMLVGHGFNVMGSHYGHSNYANVSKAKAGGAMYLPLIIQMNRDRGSARYLFDCFIDGTRSKFPCTGGGGVACPSSTKQIGQQAVNGWAANDMDKWMAVDDNNIYGWLYCLDDCRTAMRTSTTNALYQAMNNHDHKHRGIGDFGFGSSYTTSWKDTTPKMGNLISQMYFSGGNSTGDGEGSWRTRMTVGIGAFQIAESDRRSQPTINNQPRLIPPADMLGFQWSTIPAHNKNTAYTISELMHDYLLRLMMGQNGLWIYQMFENPPGFDKLRQRGAWYGDSTYATEDARTKHALFKVLDLLKDTGLSKAFLWGDRTPTEAITYKHLKGADSSNASGKGYHRGKVGTDTHLWNESNGVYTPNSHFPDFVPGKGLKHPGLNRGDYYDYYGITMRDMQYRGKRFIVLTNSMPTPASVAWWNAHPDGVVSRSFNPTTSDGSHTQAVVPNTRDTPWVDAKGNIVYYDDGYFYPDKDSSDRWKTGHQWDVGSGSVGKIQVPGSEAGGMGNIQFELGNLPINGQVKVYDHVAGIDHTPEVTSAGKLVLTMEPLQSVILVVGPADGYIGGDQPQPAPVITQHPVGGTFAVGAATPVFTVGYTPASASVQWQYRLSPATVWHDISGATSDTYHMTKTHIESAHNGDEFRAKVTTSGNPPVYSHTAHITVS